MTKEFDMQLLITSVSAHPPGVLDLVGRERPGSWNKVVPEPPMQMVHVRSPESGWEVPGLHKLQGVRPLLDRLPAEQAA